MSRRISAHYYAATSAAPLAAVCRHIQRAFVTEPFELDSHAHWEYGKASSDELAFNITRCSDNETIEKWVEDTPRGVNYQAIVWCLDSEKSRVLERFQAELEAAFGATAEHFSSASGSSSTESSAELDSPSEDIPSGFSLPLTWFIAVGFIGAAVLAIRSCTS